MAKRVKRTPHFRVGNNLKEGIFITFEGGEGSGKSTHLRSLARFLKKEGYPVLLLREPGSTPISERIRRVLLDSRHKEMDRITELFLYMAARNQLVRERIEPAIGKGKIVLCDRFHDATWVYQGYAGGCGLKLIDKLRKAALGTLMPDLTVFLDLPVKLGLRRSRIKNRMEKQGIAYHRRVRAGYHYLAGHHSRRVKLVKVNKDIAKTQKTIRDIVMDKLASCHFPKSSATKSRKQS